MSLKNFLDKTKDNISEVYSKLAYRNLKFSDCYIKIKKLVDYIFNHLNYIKCSKKNIIGFTISIIPQLK